MFAILSSVPRPHKSYHTLHIQVMMGFVSQLSCCDPVHKMVIADNKFGYLQEVLKVEMERFEATTLRGMFDAVDNDSVDGFYDKKRFILARSAQFMLSGVVSAQIASGISCCRPAAKPSVPVLKLPYGPCLSPEKLTILQRSVEVNQNNPYPSEQPLGKLAAQTGRVRKQLMSKQVTFHYERMKHKRQECDSQLTEWWQNTGTAAWCPTRTR